MFRSAKIKESIIIKLESIVYIFVYFLAVVIYYGREKKPSVETLYAYIPLYVQDIAC